jgi:uncharacterized protein (TIGR00251 family)
MTAHAQVPWMRSRDGLILRVRVTPKSSRDMVEGLEASAQGPALKVRVRAVPDKGAANAAVVETVADWIGVAKSAVKLVAGSAARVKSLAIAGDGATLEAQCARRLGAQD